MKLSEKIDRIFKELAPICVGVSMGVLVTKIAPQFAVWLVNGSLIVIIVLFFAWLIAYEAEQKD